MSYYVKGQNADDEADDFDEYDPTPYGGGYDIHITYGRPLPPSNEICHPPADSYSGDPVEFTSYADSSAYADDDALDVEYSSYTRPGYGSGAKSEYEEEEKVPEEYEAETTEFEEPSYAEEEEIEQQQIYGDDNYGEEQGGGYNDYRRRYSDD